MSETGSFFTPVNLNRVSDQVVRQIMDLIEAGKLKPGDQLPGERELTQHLSISRSAVREAIRLLEAQGMLEVKPGLGTFVSKNTGIAGLPVQWGIWMGEHQGQVLDLLEVRSALEPLAAELAACNATPADVEAMIKALDQIDHSLEEGTIGEAVEGDIAFHHLISQCSQNSFLIELNRTINVSLIENRFVYFSLPDKGATSNIHHREILEAIKAKKPAQAGEAMRQHIDTALQNTLEIINQINLNRGLES